MKIRFMYGCVKWFSPRSEGQYDNNFSMVAFNLDLARKTFSSSAANGTGVSRLAQRITGASRWAKQCSPIQADISPPIPPVRVSSCSTNTLPVLLTEAWMASKSNGCNVLRSRMSTDRPGCCAANSMAQCTPLPYVITLQSLPF